MNVEAHGTGSYDNANSNKCSVNLRNLKLSRLKLDIHCNFVNGWRGVSHLSQSKHLLFRGSYQLRRLGAALQQHWSEAHSHDCLNRFIVPS